jgi:NAD(P)-dependent dehydrogenase (short-subunit alcohol dehydrogenase family)
MGSEDMNLKQTALITGASKRIGKAISLHLASQGWNLAIHFHKSMRAAESLQDQLKKDYPEQEFVLFQSDLQNPFAVGELIPQVIQAMGQVNLLINNASIFEKADISETHFDLLDRQMMINYRAPFLLTRDFARLAGDGGAIINMVDTRITNNESDHAAYSLSKKALWELTKMAALEFAPGIRVNAIAPGVTLPPADKSEGYLHKLAEGIPMKQPTGLEPILHSLDYIIKNELLTGQLLFADGGENLGKN